MRAHHHLFTSLTLLALLPSAWGQSLAPNAGSQIQQIPPSPVPLKAPPRIDVAPVPAEAPAPAAEQAFTVQRVHITGAEVFTEAALLAVTGFVPGREWTLSGLRALAAKVADHYRDRGYFVAQAYLPAQDIVGGVVTVVVLEGRYGAITLRNQSTLSQDLLARVMRGVQAGDAVRIDPLERRLLSLSDLPGVKVKSTLVPGASLGASDLIVEVDPGQRFTGSVDADNQGSRYTGETRLGATVNFNNPTGHGDVASLRAMTAGDDLNYGRVAYQVQLGMAKLGVAHASMNYALGREFERLQFKGSTRINSLYGSVPLMRSRRTNLQVQLAYDDKRFQDRQEATATVTDKQARAWMASLQGDFPDAWGGGASNTYGLTATQGRIGAPATVARSQGDYSKLGLSASRLQSLGTSVSLYASFTAQWASKNLDSSEKMGLAGANAVRAYPEGAVYGDQGHVLTLEGRALLPVGLPGQWQGIGFADAGRVTLNKRPWDTARNHQTLSGVGVGLNWAGGPGVVVKAYYAHGVGAGLSDPNAGSPSRLSLQLIKYF